MAQCPKCQAKIESLDYTAIVHHCGEFKIEGDGFNFDEDAKDLLNEAEYIFSCPACLDDLFYDYEEAEEFLKKPKEKREDLTPNLFEDIEEVTF